MSFWVELHCDSPIADHPGDECGRNACETGSNNSPGMKVKFVNRLPFAARALAKEAIERGWKRDSKKNWTCNACLKARKSLQEASGQ